MDSSRLNAGDAVPGEENPQGEEVVTKDLHSAYTGFLRERRLITFERDIKSVPVFLAWCCVTAVFYLLLGWGHWDFREPGTGEISWSLIGCFALVCVSFTYLFWPTPKRKKSE